MWIIPRRPAAVLTVAAIGLLSVAALADSPQSSDSTSSPAATITVVDTAAAVILADSTFIKIDEKGRGTLRNRCIVRVNSVKGRDGARFSIEDSKLVRIIAARGRLFDRTGKLLDSLVVLKDFFKVCGFGPEIALYSDVCEYNGSFKDVAPPFVVDWEYEADVKSLAFSSGWVPRQDLYLKTAFCEFSFSDANPMRFRSLGTIQTVDSIASGGRTILRWRVSDLAPPKWESAVPWPYQYFASVLYSPRFYDFGGVQIVGDSWQSLSAGYAKVVKDAFKSSGAQQKFLEQAQKTSSGSLPDDIHRALARRLRYVAIYPELGGWIPHAATETFDNGYGDCKDLATLYSVLFSRAGFETHLVALANRSGELVSPEFPTLGLFNHVILVMISGPDTNWIDPTCFDCAVGDLPYSDEGLAALIIDPLEGKLVTTPLSGPADNIAIRKVAMTVAADLSVKAAVIVELIGNYGHSLDAWVGDPDPAAARRKIRSIAGLGSGSGSEIDVASARIVSRDLSRVAIAFNCKMNSSVRAVGETHLIDLSTFAIFSADELSDLTRRRYPLETGSPGTILDSISIVLPAGFSWKTLPDSVTLTSSLGNFGLASALLADTLIVTRTMVRRGGIIDTLQFNDYLEFRNGVSQKAKTPCSFVSRPK
jgi:hypothetical protein